MFSIKQGLLCFTEFLKLLFIKLYLVSYNCWCSWQQCQYISSYFLSAWHPLSDVVGDLEGCAWFHPYCFLLQGVLEQTKKISAENFMINLGGCCHLQLAKSPSIHKSIRISMLHLSSSFYINSYVFSSNALLNTFKVFSKISLHKFLRFIYVKY